MECDYEEDEIQQEAEESIVETEIRTVDFRLNKEIRKTLISQRSRISARANDKWPNICGNYEKITNEFRENNWTYFESA